MTCEISDGEVAQGFFIPETDIIAAPAVPLDEILSVNTKQGVMTILTSRGFEPEKATTLAQNGGVKYAGAGIVFGDRVSHYVECQKITTAAVVKAIATALTTPGGGIKKRDAFEQASGISMGGLNPIDAEWPESTVAVEAVLRWGFQMVFNRPFSKPDVVSGNAFF